MKKSQLLDVVTTIQNSDDELYQELREIHKSQESIERPRKMKDFKWDNSGEVVNEVVGPKVNESDLGLETIVLRVGRPVLEISNNQTVLEFRDAESLVWRNRLLAVKEKLAHAATAVGRIELQNNSDFEWVGTGWLVDSDILVSNRHVANEFSEANGKKFIFKQGFNGKSQKASIDFLEEVKSTEELNFTISEILYVEDQPGPDIAFFRVAGKHNNLLPVSIKLSEDVTHDGQRVATIGYPAEDDRIPEKELMAEIFGNVYEKKRLAPGLITGVSNVEIKHDCSTLGGNSGSVVLDLETGEAVGLHYAGRFLEANFAVSARVINDRLKKVRSLTKVETQELGSDSPSSNHLSLQLNKQNMESEKPFTLTIPLQLHITVSLSGGVTNLASTQQPSVAMNAPSAQESGETFFTEGKPSDYANRKGFDTKFLETGPEVPLPVILSKNDVLTYQLEGKKEHVLKYRHFSVVMSISRRQCFFSAVNIDGKTSVPMDRGPWRLDPRISEKAQIMKECYGNAPKFSRGHMTRREDPIWGDESEAKQGNTDSMHVTNTVPQMQNMNAGIWLALENYALQNARKDDMRISVITGPVFRPADPIKFGVIIPLEFWKIIVFIHDETKKITATGYKISQASFLQNEELIFGAHKTNQVSILSIEKDTGLSFGPLSALDPLSKATESVGAIDKPIRLNSLTEVVFN
jgi:endonuclease G